MGTPLTPVYYTHLDVSKRQVQTLYQSSERLVEIYKTLNFDYQQQITMQLRVSATDEMCIRDSL